MTLIDEPQLLDDILCLMQGKYGILNPLLYEGVIKELNMMYGVDDPFNLTPKQGREYRDWLKEE